jgi:hypothetical protein
MTFTEQPTYQIGQIGERLIDEFLKQKGYVPYYPLPGVAHPFDRLIATPDKRRICIVEVKTKCRREAYDDTGINQRHFDDYQHITFTYSLPLFLAFVDAKVGQIYGNYWTELLKTREPEGVVWLNGKAFGHGGCQSYPWTDRGIVYFPLSAMRVLHVLTAEERAEILAKRTTGWR